MKFEFWENKKKIYGFTVFLFAFLLYANSIKNNYSLDDELVTLNNSRVEKGINGIPEILRTFHSIDNKAKYEYRPTVLISFALEYEFFGRNPHISHFINVLIYSLTCVLIFYLLSNLFSNFDFSLPFLATLFFAAHPLHTEVVNNLKSRDELFALFFGLIALIFIVRFSENKKIFFLFLGFLFLFLAILSKKSAMIFIGIIPLTLYFFTNIKWKNIFLIGLVSLGAYFSYGIFKPLMLNDTAVRVFYYFENPLFLEPDFIHRISASLYTIWYYFELHIFPHPLSFYYGYNQVPIAKWNELQVWISLIFHSGIFIYALKKIKKKHILSYAILFYLIAVFPFSNFIFPMVGIIGERFVYVASLGFCIALAYLILKFKLQNASLKISVAAIILMLYSFKTITRNPDWKDHLTLYRHDIRHLEKSAKAHALISNTIYPQLFTISDGNEKRRHLEEAIFHYKKALEIYPDYITCNNNIGTIYFTFIGDFKTANQYYKRAVSLDKSYVEAHYNLALSYEKLLTNDSAIYFYEKTISLDKNYKPAYDKLQQLYFSLGKYDEAVKLNLNAAENFPENKVQHFVNIANSYSAKHDTLHALNFFIKAFEQEKNDKDLCLHISKIYRKINNENKAEEYYKMGHEISKSQ